MNAGKPTRPDRVESAVRGMLAFVLLAAVIWAVMNGGDTAPGFDLGSLPRW